MTAAPGTLAAYEQLVLDQLGAAPAGSIAGADVTRWAVQRWATTSIRDLCPLTATLLELRERLGVAVEEHRLAGDRPLSAHAWAQAFLARVASYDDRLLADVAALELAITAPADTSPHLPDPWVWHVDPRAVVVALGQGIDPALLPATAAVLVRRRPDGGLEMQPA